MNFVKERNFIVAYDGEDKLGAWDITTGNFIGKKGKQVKNTPSCFNYDNLPQNPFDRNRDFIIGYAIKAYRNWIGSWNYNYSSSRAARYESMISLGIMPCTYSDLDSTIPLTKDVVKFIKEECNGYYSENQVATYYTEKKYDSFLNDKPTWIQQVFKVSYKNVPVDYLKAILNRMQLEHANNFFPDYSVINEIPCIIKNYYEFSMELYGKVEVPHNILTQYANLNYLYEQHKYEHYDETLKKNNDKPWLYYENENYVVRPLLTREEFHEEATAQSNCVERLYMERVRRKETHVVVVRRKSNPNKSYITCEVNNRGNIIQYLYSHNRRPAEESVLNFRDEYQEYLKDAIAD